MAEIVQSMMNVTAVSSEDRLVTQEAPAHRQQQMTPPDGRGAVARGLQQAQAALAT